MIWIPALAALGAMRSSQLEWERRQQNISQSAAAVVARQQIAFQCDLFESTCQRIRMWTENHERIEVMDCDMVLEYGVNCLYALHVACLILGNVLRIRMLRRSMCCP